MLEELELEELYDDTRDINIEICPSNMGSGNPDNIPVGDAREVILSHIGIQVALADILLTDAEDENDNKIAFIYLSERENGDMLLDRISKIFNGIHMVKDESDSLCAFEVYYPGASAVEAFRGAFDGKLLNRWIYEFYQETGIDDQRHISLYRYKSDSDKAADTDLLRKDEFFNYIIYGHRFGSGISVSQYKLEEIDKVPFIAEINAAVSRLFLVVSLRISPDGKEIYDKMLVWNRLKEEK